MSHERKNTVRNARRVSVKKKPLFGYGGRMYFPQSNLSEYERKLLKLGLY